MGLQRESCLWKRLRAHLTRRRKSLLASLMTWTPIIKTLSGSIVPEAVRYTLGHCEDGKRWSVLRPGYSKTNAGQTDQSRYYHNDM